MLTNTAKSYHNFWTYRNIPWFGIYEGQETIIKYGPDGYYMDVEDFKTIERIGISARNGISVVNDYFPTRVLTFPDFRKGILTLHKSIKNPIILVSINFGIDRYVPTDPNGPPSNTRPEENFDFYIKLNSYRYRVNLGRLKSDLLAWPQGDFYLYSPYNIPVSYYFEGNLETISIEGLQNNLEVGISLSFLSDQIPNTIKVISYKWAGSYTELKTEPHNLIANAHFYFIPKNGISQHITNYTIIDDTIRFPYNFGDGENTWLEVF